MHAIGRRARLQCSSSLTHLVRWHQHRGIWPLALLRFEMPIATLESAAVPDACLTAPVPGLLCMVHPERTYTRALIRVAYTDGVFGQPCWYITAIPRLCRRSSFPSTITTPANIHSLPAALPAIPATLTTFQRRQLLAIRHIHDHRPGFISCSSAFTTIVNNDPQRHRPDL